MWQCGQIAETMSRSSDCSTAQSALALGSGLVRPFWFTMRRQPGGGRALAQLEVAPVGGQVDRGVGVPVGVDDGHGLVPAPDQGVAGEVVGLAQRGRPVSAGGRRGRGEGRGVLARSPERAGRRPRTRPSPAAAPGRPGARWPTRAGRGGGAAGGVGPAGGGRHRRRGRRGRNCHGASGGNGEREKGRDEPLVPDNPHEILRSARSPRPDCRHRSGYRDGFGSSKPIAAPLRLAKKFSKA